MTEQINPNLIYQRPQVGYGASPQNLSSSINNNTVIKSSSDQNDSKRKKFIMPPLVAGIYYGMSQFNKACRGDYESTLLGKSAKLGDKISKWKIIDNSFVHNLVAKTIKYHDKFFSNVVPKNKILNAFFNHPTEPKVNMVITQASGPLAEMTKDTASKILDITDKGQNVEKLKAFGFDDVKELEEIANKTFTNKENSKKLITNLENYMKENGEELITKKGTGFKVPFANGKHLTEVIKSKKLEEFLTKKVSFSEYLNKLKALSGTSGVGASRLGKMLPKALLRSVESLTASSTGGIFAAVMGAWFLTDVVNNTIKAKGFNEKRKAFPENLIYLMGWYITMPISTKIMHNVGGLKYVGVKDVDKYRDELYKFNAKASGYKVDGNKFVKLTDEEMEAVGGRFNNKEEYKAAKKALKTMLKGDAKWYQKPLKFLGRTISVGLEQIRPYVAKDAGKSIELAKNSKFWLKQGAGYPMRFLIFAMVTSPFFAKIGAKLSDVIFGKPKHSVLDEDKEDKNAQQDSKAAQSQQYIGQPLAGNQNANALLNNTPVKQGQNPQAQVANNTAGNVDYAKNSTQPKAAPKRTYSYIPSSNPVVIRNDNSNNNNNNSDTAKMNKAMTNFDTIANNIEKQYTK